MLSNKSTVFDRITNFGEVNMTKSTHFLRSIIVLGLAASVLVSAGCPRRQTTTFELQHPPTRVTVRHTIEWLAPVNDLNSQIANNLATGILDLANPWEPDSFSSPNAVVKVLRADNQIVQETFALVPVSGTLPAVDKDTTPYYFSIQDEQALADFISQESAGLTETEIEVEFVFTVVQVDCEIPNGDYTSHFRSLDNSGVTFFSSMTFQYSVPDNVHGSDRCLQAEITLK